MAVTIDISSITQNSQSVANNTSNVTVTLIAKWAGGSWNHTGQCYGSLTIDGTKYSFSNVILNKSRTTSGSQTLMTKTVNVTHSADGTKTLNCSASFYTGLDSSGTNGTVTDTASKTLTTIPRKSSLTVGNGTLGTAQSVKVTRQATSFSHSIKISCGSVTRYLTASGGLSTSEVKHTDCDISYTPPLDWASQNTTGTSVTVTYTITTYSGSTNVGSTSYKKACSIPASVIPSCSVKISESTSYLGTYGALIKGYSKLKVDITPTLAYNSAISSYNVTANGTKYSKASFTTGVITSSGSVTVTAKVTDKRGRTSNIATSDSLTVLNYEPPSISQLKVGRCDADGNPDDQGSNVKVTFGYSITSLNGKNTATCTLKYKRSADSAYIVPTNFDPSTGSYLFAAETESSYDIVISVTDHFKTTTKSTSASTAYSIMHWKANGRGVAFGKLAEDDDTLDVGMILKTNHGEIPKDAVALSGTDDLNSVLTPGFYIFSSASSSTIANMPIGGSGSGSVEVVREGESTQVRQVVTRCSVAYREIWERLYYSNTWQEWMCLYKGASSTGSGRFLWSGAYYMTASQTANLSEPIRSQPNGIILVFSRYSDDTARNYHYNHFFVSKHFVNRHSGVGSTFIMGTGEPFATMASKYLYINNTSIVGNDNNSASGTAASGIKYDNSGFVLRYVIGV